MLDVLAATGVAMCAVAVIRLVLDTAPEAFRDER
jgi:hypothetical protein